MANLENLQKLRDYIATLPEDSVSLSYTGPADPDRRWPKHARDLFKPFYHSYAEALELNSSELMWLSLSGICVRLRDCKQVLLDRLDLVIKHANSSAKERMAVFHPKPWDVDSEMDCGAWIVDANHLEIDFDLLLEYIKELEAKQ